MAANTAFSPQLPQPLLTLSALRFCLTTQPISLFGNAAKTNLFQTFPALFYRPKGSWFWWETSQLSPPHFGSAHQAFLQQEVTATVLHVSALKCPFQISDSASLCLQNQHAWLLKQALQVGFSAKLPWAGLLPSPSSNPCTQPAVSPAHCHQPAASFHLDMHQPHLNPSNEFSCNLGSIPAAHHVLQPS